MDATASPELRSPTSPDLPQFDIQHALNGSLLKSDLNSSSPPPPAHSSSQAMVAIVTQTPGRQTLWGPTRRRSFSEGDRLSFMQVDDPYNERKRSRRQADFTSDSIAANSTLDLSNQHTGNTPPSLPRLRPLPGRCQRSLSHPKKRSKH